MTSAAYITAPTASYRSANYGASYTVPIPTSLHVGPRYRRRRRRRRVCSRGHETLYALHGSYPWTLWLGLVLLEARSGLTQHVGHREPTRSVFVLLEIALASIPVKTVQPPRYPARVVLGIVHPPPLLSMSLVPMCVVGLVDRHGRI